jgi:transposase
MANTQRDLGQEGFWRAVLGRWAKSGLSIRAFCREEKLREPSFYSWRRTIAERDAKRRALPAPAFLPVVLSDRGVASPTEISIELRGGRILRLSDSIPPTRLAAIVVALEGAEVGA